MHFLNSLCADAGHFQQATNHLRKGATSLILTLGLLAQSSLCLAADDSLARGFQNPPTAAKPQIWWTWMNGNITREGITADLEAMHRIGLSEADIMTVSNFIPAGPVPVMSPQFMDMIEFSAKEAKRLGMTLCLHNCPGWSNSGGPWVTPKDAMQVVTTSETSIRGPVAFSGKLEQPPTTDGFYRDIAILAFPTPTGEREPLSLNNEPTVTTSVSGISPTSLVDPGSTKLLNFPPPTKGRSYFIQVEYPHSFAALTLSIRAGSMASAGGKILASDDGENFRLICPFTIPARSSVSPVVIPLGPQPVAAKFFRVQFDHAIENSPRVVLKEICFSSRIFIPDLGGKAAFEAKAVESAEVARDRQIKVAPEFIVPRGTIVDLTSALKPDGSLKWDVPKGEWTILRIGYTNTGKTNHPAPPEATGLECDKLSPQGIEASWNGMMRPIIERLGPLAGKVLVDCLIDSYEVGDQNWTPRMLEEFRRLRGYDPTLLLPVMTGRYVDSPEVSERFLWDLRRTVADLFAENYYGHFTELCNRDGLKSMEQAYTGPYESLQSGATGDIPMGEFWSGSHGSDWIKMASSIGHIYDHPIVAAESFTGRPEHDRWTDDPNSLKALGDLAFCEGINRFVFSRFAHQPWLDKYPGMTMGPYGINFDRTNTWFEPAKAWMQYLARSQFLLQQGKAVNDVAYFDGLSAPVVTRSGNPALPRGFDYDDVDAGVLSRAKVIDHRIVLSSGASYAVLVLPKDDPDLTPQLLGKLRDLVNDGATLVGSRPERSPSLQDYPACDQEVQKLAQEMWGDINGKSVTEHTLGQGKVVCGQTLDQVLANLSLPRDFEPATPTAPLLYTHRRLKDGDIYFVSNQGSSPLRQDCTFRLSGKIPELAHPDTGVLEPAPAYQVKGGRITVPLDFDSFGSVFVVFRKPDSTADHAVTAAWELVPVGQPIEIKGPWKLSFPPHWGAPPQVTLDQLISWSDSPDPGIRYFSGTATYTKDIEISADLLAKDRQLILDLGQVKNLAQVKLNGVDLGILWKVPFRTDITSAARAGTNHLEISITNLWPNRLIGDAQTPDDVSWGPSGKLNAWPKWLLEGKPSPSGRLTFTTWHHYTKDMPLLPSGLIGPVTLQAAQSNSVTAK